MNDRGERLDIVYDGGCMFCRRSLGLVRRLARREIFRLHDAADRAEVGRRFPALADANLDDAMFAIDSRGRVSRGFFAFRRLMWASPWLYPFLPLFYCPGASIVGPMIYAWVARHRQRLGCSTSACDIVPENRSLG